MSWLALGLGGVSLLTAVTILLLLGRPQLLLGHGDRPAGGASRAGAAGAKILAFLTFCAVPIGLTAIGTTSHMERSKTTSFCLSCHVMGPWGESLKVDDAGLLAASHYQNGRIDRDQACFTCHTTYTMFGDAKAKMNGMRHVWAFYTRTVPEKIELYSPYQNRECLHCHGGARSYEENDMHVDDLAALASGETSCLECHEPAHGTEDMEGKPRWQAPPVVASAAGAAGGAR